MKRIYKAFIYSLHGLRAAWNDEVAFKQEVILAIIAIPTAFFLAPTITAMLLMQVSVLFVLVVELLNTAIEACIDRHGEDIHPLAKKAKDCGSAAVLVSLIIALLIWISFLF